MNNDILLINESVESIRLKILAFIFCVHEIWDEKLMQHKLVEKQHSDVLSSINDVFLIEQALIALLTRLNN